MAGGWADPQELEKGDNGRALCRWCRLEVPLRRRTFCSDWCVQEWKLRTDPGYLREQVFKRDRGRCAICRIDANAAWIEIKKARGRKRDALLLRWGLKKLLRSSLWDADHIIPVVEGGGECDLSNLRTLCLVCHREQTRLLRLRIRKGLPQPSAAAELQPGQDGEPGCEH